MAATYLPYEPDQDFLLPPSLNEWLPESHLAYFISDSVDALDRSAFHARYEAGGPRNQPFHLAMMVKVLLYAYARGVFSSRKIAAKLHEDVAFRLLAACNQPAGRTIRDFRASHLKELGELFVQVVRLAWEMGPVKLGTIAEPPNGWIKSVLGFRQFSMRGLHRITAQWKLVCAALNLRRMCSLQPSAAPA